MFAINVFNEATLLSDAVNKNANYL